MKNDKTKFTLVELLLVIAVITILAGMLFPTLARTKNKATVMNCLTNLNGIGKAMMLYSNEFTYLPSAGVAQGNDRGKSASNVTGDGKNIYPLIDNKYTINKVFICERYGNSINNNDSSGVVIDYHYSVRNSTKAWIPSDLYSDSALLWDYDDNHGIYTSLESEGGNVLILGGSAKALKSTEWLSASSVNARIGASN